jgi:hypothetical protein
MGTFTLPGADIRGYYSRLGVAIPERPGAEASVRCFAQPGAHRHQDRDPSCQVNLQSGAWRCWGCGERGGAYDAAIILGHTPRSAIELMIAHGLTEPRNRPGTARQPAPVTSPQAPDRPYRPAWTPALPTELELASYQARLARRPALIARLQSERGWGYPVMRELGLGLDRGRITIPIRNAHGRLRGLLRYQPWPGARPKMLALAGSRLGLIPHPAAEPAQQLLLVEGPPDMIAARTQGLPAIAVPGTDSFKPAWASLLAGREVTIIMDSDPQGRAGAQRIAEQLEGHASHVEILDLAPGREDGYDLTDWLTTHAAEALRRIRASQ